MSRTRAASSANRHLGLALVVIATAQLMVVLDNTDTRANVKMGKTRTHLELTAKPG